MSFSWIVVSDLDEAVEFYTDVVGLKADGIYTKMGWAELVGTGGARLGLVEAKANLEAGRNAIFTITVEHIEATARDFTRKGAERIGTFEQIPGMGKTQLFRDKDGNLFQLQEPLA